MGSPFVFWFAIVLIAIFAIIIVLVAWGSKRSSNHNNRRSSFIQNPHPDTQTFVLAQRSDPFTDCPMGSFTIQRISRDELTYTVLLETGLFVTDIYTLEVNDVCDFPLTIDRCAVDLSAYHHENYPCTSNVQSFTSSITTLDHLHDNVYFSILVVYTTDSTSCLPVELMTLKTGKPIPLDDFCVVPTCPTGTCCNPDVPHYERIRLTCPPPTLVRSLDSSSSSSHSNSSSSNSDGHITMIQPAQPVQPLRNNIGQRSRLRPRQVAPANPIEPTPIDNWIDD